MKSSNARRAPKAAASTPAPPSIPTPAATNSIGDGVTPLRVQAVPKLSGRSSGLVTYQIGLDATGGLCLSIVANDGGGYFSTERVPFSRVRERLAAQLASGEDFPTSALRPAFVGRSVNNGCFLAAILRNEGLLQAGEKPHLHRRAGDWDAWEAMQKSAGPSVPAQGGDGLVDAPAEADTPAPALEEGDNSADRFPPPNPVQPGMTMTRTPPASRPPPTSPARRRWRRRKAMKSSEPLFQLGQVVATPNALAVLAGHGVDPATLLDRHVKGDWGVLPPEDAKANNTALRHGELLLSSYPLADGVKVWIITEWDRSVTTILMPDDY